MKELKVGERVTTTLEVVEQGNRILFTKVK